jgi:uncharacterized protein
MSEYQPTQISKVKRAHERGHYDYDTVHRVLDSSPFCHVAYVIDGQPYTTPTLKWRVGSKLFWHGSSASRMLRSLRDGMRACLTVTHFDGYVMARSPMHHSANYRSVMAFGTAHVIEDEAEKVAALNEMMEQLFAGRLADVRDHTDQELKATMVVSMEIDEASAKIRDGGPIDDEEDYELGCWAGVIPIVSTFGAPIDDDRLSDGIEYPDYLKGLVGTSL